MSGGISESVQFTGGGSGIAATPAKFPLKGGRYGFKVNAATFGSVTLQALSLDGSTLITVAPAATSNGSQVIDLPPGTYQLTISGATGVFADITSVPN